MRAVPQKILLGQRFAYYKKGLPPSSSHTLTIKYNDTMDNVFSNSLVVRSDSFGRLNIPEEQISNLISTSRPEKINSAFILKEFESTELEFNLGGASEIVVVESGLQSGEIIKEELRGDIVGNFFYPSKEGKYPVIVHINGGINHIQDSRSTMLAREGYCVLELAYNVQEYGQPVLFTRKDFPLEYVEHAIMSIVKHERAYGDRVVLMGQCKGTDIAVGFGSLRPDLVEFVIAQAGMTQLPVATDTSYQGKRWKRMDVNYLQAEELMKLVKYFSFPKDKEDIFRVKYGTFLAFKGDHGPLFLEDEENEGKFYLNENSANSIKEQAFPVHQINKLFFFSTLDDPTMAPSPELAMEASEFFLGHQKNVEMDFIHSGHLAVTPEIPVVEKSVMNFAGMKCEMKWSSNSTDEDKIKEASEHRRLFRKIKETLHYNL